MNSINYVILGAGGTGRTALSVFESMDSLRNQKVIFYDDKLVGTIVNNTPVLDTTSSLLDFKNSNNLNNYFFNIAFGSMFMDQRDKYFNYIKQLDLKMFNIIHKSVVIDRTSKIGVGNIICSNSVLHPNLILNNNCVICTGTTIDHDCHIGDNVYFSPGVHLAGGVIVEKNTFIGTGAVVIPSIKIGEGAIIGAGAVVIKDVEPYSTIVGIPGEITKKRRASV